METSVQTHTHAPQPVHAVASATLANVNPAVQPVPRKAGGGKFPIGSPYRGRVQFPVPIQFGGK